jgi:hypothetical protein
MRLSQICGTQFEHYSKKNEDQNYSENAFTCGIIIVT